MTSDNGFEEAFFTHLDEQRKSDPLIGAKLGAKEVNARLMRGFKEEQGVHIQSLLCALGSLAGYACQVALREHCARHGISEAKSSPENPCSIRGWRCG